MKMKGQAMGGLSNSAVAVIMLVLVVAVGATILITIQGTQYKSTPVQINNESNTYKYGTAYTTVRTPVTSVVQLRDTTTVLGTANYTVSGNTITLSSVQRVNASKGATGGVNLSEGDWTVPAGTTGLISILDGYNTTVRFTSGNFTIKSPNIINATDVVSLAYVSEENITITYSYARYNNSLLNTTYIYTQDVLEQDWNITNQGLSALGTFGSFFSVIVVVVIFAVIIGLFMYMFAGRRGGGI